MAQETQLTRKAVVLAKVEGTYGQNANPGTSNGILVNNGVDVEPIGEKIKRDVVRGTFSPAGVVIGSKKINFKCQVELRGGGLDVGGSPLPPDCDPLLLACGMQRVAVTRLTVSAVAGFVIGEEITGGTSSAHGVLHHIDGTDTLVLTGVTGEFQAETVTGATSAATAEASADVKALEYRPATKRPVVQDSATVLFYKDAILYTVVGARGTWTLSCAVNKYPLFDFNLSGLWTDPADAATPPVPELTDITPPLFMGANVVIGSYVPVLTEFSFNLANSLADRLDANSAEGLVGILITGREPSGSVNPEMDSLANFNPWTPWKTASTARIAALLGQAPGNRVRLEVPKAQYDGLKHTDRSGLAAYTASFVANADRAAGDDEFRMTIF